MKKYQLIGRKNIFVRLKPSAKLVTYPYLHLCSLPVEILLAIFAQFDDPENPSYTTLVNLALTCKKFQAIVYKHIFYHHVLLKSPAVFFKFCERHLAPNHASSKINYIKLLVVKNPPIRDSSNFKLKIAGHYKFEQFSNGNLGYADFLGCLAHLMNEAYGLKVLSISEISPDFGFPVDTSGTHGSSSGSSSSSASASLNFASIWGPKKKPILRNSRTLQKLVLKTQSGWSIPFRLSNISLIFNSFDVVQELELVKFIIDDYKLTVDPCSVKVHISTLNLNACMYAPTFKKRHPTKKLIPCPLFEQVTSLNLYNIQTGNDLAIIDFIKLNNRLKTLSLDMASSIFYTTSSSVSVVNPVKKVFNFAKYNRFFKLVCSGHGGYSTLNELILSDFDLVEYFDHNTRHQLELSDVDSWVEPSTDNFESFLAFLSSIANLSIILSKNSTVTRVKTCVNCGFTTTSNDLNVSSLSASNWTVLLKPLLLSNDEKCNVKVYNHNLHLLFSRTQHS